jgi:hypothetical protein
MNIKFSKKALTSADPFPFTDPTGSFVLDLQYITCPAGYEWCSDWILDIRGEVDEQGWSYNTSFLDQSGWQSFPKGITVVRRRRWQRMRELTLTKDTLQTLNFGPAKIRQDIGKKRFDRERLEILKTNTLYLENLDEQLVLDFN